MPEIDVPPEWERIDLSSMAGTVMVIGRSDRGKTTLVRYLVRQLLAGGRRVGWLDADIGQSTLGVPTTMNLAVISHPDQLRHVKPDATFFVGSTSPRGHMLPAIVGTYRLQQRAYELDADVVVADTTGLVSPEAGGGALKQWKIALLQPSTVIALQRYGELVHILAPLLREPTIRVQVFPVSQAVNPKAVEERIARRRRRFQQYFEGAGTLTVDYAGLAVYDLERAGPQRLLAFQDREGFARGLGVIMAMDRRQLMVCTPMRSLAGITSLRIGSLRLNPDTGEERR